MVEEDVIIGERSVIRSKTLREERPLLIHLPDGYEKSRERYPVVYLLDGGYKARFANTASTVQLLYDAGQIPNMIVVGVEDTNHVRDLFPVEIRGRGGGANNFLSFLTEELVPHVDSNYRTAPYRILMGASNSGLFTVYALLTRPEVFNAYVAVSPMIGWCSEFIYEKTRAFLSKDIPSKRLLYMPYGSDDYKEVTKYLPEYVQLIEPEARGKLIWGTKVLKGEGHVPVPCLYDSIKFIFPEWSFPHAKLVDEGLDGIRKFFHRLSEKYGFEVKIPESVLLDLGHELLEKGEEEASISSLKFLIEAYPHSGRAHYLLGVVYQRTKQKELAIECFEKAMKLDPTMKAYAQNKLEELKT